MMKSNLSLIELTSLIDAVNKARAAVNFAELKNSLEEEQLHELFNCNENLAVYGTLAPGRENYHIVEHLGGEWTDGLIEGDLQQTGWGATLGYPAFRPRTGGPSVQIKVLKSSALPQGWRSVDEFEGPDYKRILVPVYRITDDAATNEKRHLYTVANLYAARS